MEVGEQEDCGRAVEVICREDGWDASADATHCAVPMDFAASRVHFNEIEPLTTSIIVWLSR